MTERRYREQEVREIFGLAASGEPLGRARVSDPAGLTLSDLQSIGAEAGLEPARIAQAAALLDARRSALPRRTSFGMPIAVGRTVELPRAPTDHEWEQLVAELRATFGARGRVTSHGNLREWANGNLHACIEPGEKGHRLRMGTLKGDATSLNAIGAISLSMAAVFSGGLLIAGGLAESMMAPISMAALGMGAFVANLIRLPGWARTREQQMQHIADRVRAIMKPQPEQ